MPYEVPPLPYAYDALEPHIDADTMRFHHDKHHQAYVDKANAALWVAAVLFVVTTLAVLAVPDVRRLRARH